MNNIFISGIDYSFELLNKIMHRIVLYLEILLRLKISEKDLQISFYGI